MEDYQEFLVRKVLVASPCGFNPVTSLMPQVLKQFQRDIVTWACRRGRAAIFAGTGLGKTLQQLVWAHQVVAHTGGRVLIFAPLAVGPQTVKEAVKFGIDDVAYASDEDSIKTSIVVTNYERRHLFDLSQFAGIVCDESSILKSENGKTRAELQEATEDVPYKLCCTATPAPNDWTELGQHAEFLGVMSAKEMLAMFFVHEGSVRADAGVDEWRLKRHAESDFWRWLSSWAVMLSNPNDLGYDEPDYVLPALNLHQVTVRDTSIPVTKGMLFALEAKTMSERRGAKRSSMSARVKAACDIVKSKPDRQWGIWCDLNDEGVALAEAIEGSLEVAGRHDPAIKIERLLGFCEGKPKHLITKGKIGAWGMNWQHCHSVILVGLNDSFEQLFQIIRRYWRFGQVHPVDVYMIASELEGAVVANLRAKEAKHDKASKAMIKHMRGFSEAIVRGGRVSTGVYEPTVKMELPLWIQMDDVRVKDAV